MHETLPNCERWHEPISLLAAGCLPAEEEAGMQHHFDQEGSLALREAEGGNPPDALLVRHRNSSKMRGLGLRPDRPPRPPRPVLMR